MAANDVESCSQCAFLRLKLEKAESEHSTRFLNLKKKIISTDLLITKYKAQSNELSSCRAKLDSAALRMKTVASELTDAESNLQTAKSRVQSLTRTNEQLEKRCQKQNGELARNKDVITYLEGSNKQLTVSCQNFEKQLEEQKLEVSIAKSQLKEAQRIKTSKEVTAALKEEVKGLKAELKKQKQEHEKQLKELKQSLASSAKTALRTRKPLPVRGKLSKPPSPDEDSQPPKDKPSAVLPVINAASLTDSEDDVDSIGSDLDVPFSKDAAVAIQEKHVESISSLPSSVHAVGETSSSELPGAGNRCSRRLSLQDSKDELKGHTEAPELLSTGSIRERKKSAFRKPAAIERRTLSSSSTECDEDVDSVLSAMIVSLRPRLISPLRPPLPREMTARAGSQLELPASSVSTFNRRIDLKEEVMEPEGDKQPERQGEPSSIQSTETSQELLGEISSSSDEETTSDLSHNASDTSLSATSQTSAPQADLGADRVKTNIDAGISDTQDANEMTGSSLAKTDEQTTKKLDHKVVDQSQKTLQSSTSVLSNEVENVKSPPAVDTQKAVKAKEVAGKAKPLPVVKKIIRRAAPSLPDLDLLSRKYPMRDAQADMEDSKPSEDQQQEPSAPSMSVDSLRVESISSGKKRIARVASIVPDVPDDKAGSNSQGDECLAPPTVIQKPATENTQMSNKHRGKSKQSLSGAEDIQMSVKPSVLVEEESKDSVANKMVETSRDESKGVNTPSEGNSIASDSTDLAAQKGSLSKQRKSRPGSHQSRLEHTRQRSAMKAQLIEERQKIVEESLRTTVAVQQVADGWEAALKRRSAKQKPTVEPTMASGQPAEMTDSEKVEELPKIMNEPSKSLTENVVAAENQSKQLRVALNYKSDGNDELNRGEGRLSTNRSPCLKATLKHVAGKDEPPLKQETDNLTTSLEKSNSQTVGDAMKGNTQRSDVALTSSPPQPIKVESESAVGLRRSLRKRKTDRACDPPAKKVRTPNARNVENKQSRQDKELSTTVSSGEGEVLLAAEDRKVAVGSASSDPQCGDVESVQTRSNALKLSDSTSDTAGMALTSEDDLNDSTVRLGSPQVADDIRTTNSMLVLADEQTTSPAADAQSCILKDSTKAHPPSDITPQTLPTLLPSPPAKCDTTCSQSDLTLSSEHSAIDSISLSTPPSDAEKTSEGRRQSSDMQANPHITEPQAMPFSTNPNPKRLEVSDGQSLAMLSSSTESLPSTDEGLTSDVAVSSAQAACDVEATPALNELTTSVKLCSPSAQSSNTISSFIASTPTDGHTSKEGLSSSKVLPPPVVSASSDNNMSPATPKSFTSPSSGAPFFPDGPVSPSAPLSPDGPASPSAPLTPDGPASPSAPMSPDGPASPGAPDSPLLSPLQSDSELVIVEEPAIIPTSPGVGVEYDNTEVHGIRSCPDAVTVDATTADLSTTLLQDATSTSLGEHLPSNSQRAPPVDNTPAKPAALPSYVPQRSRPLALFGGFLATKDAANQESASSSVSASSTLRRSARIRQNSVSQQGLLSPPAKKESSGNAAVDEQSVRAEETSEQEVIGDGKITPMERNENVVAEERATPKKTNNGAVINSEKTTPVGTATFNSIESSKKSGKSKRKGRTSTMTSGKSDPMTSSEVQSKVNVSSVAVPFASYESREDNSGINVSFDSKRHDESKTGDPTVSDAIQSAHKRAGESNSESADSVPSSDAKPASTKDPLQAAVNEEEKKKVVHSSDLDVSQLSQQSSSSNAGELSSNASDSTDRAALSLSPGTSSWMYSALGLPPLFSSKMNYGKMSPIKNNEDIKAEEVKSEVPVMPLDVIKLTSPPKLPAASHSAKATSILAKEMAARSMFAASTPSAGKVGKKKFKNNKSGGKPPKGARGKAKKKKTFGLPVNPMYGQGFWDPDASAGGVKASFVKPAAAQDPATGSRPLLSYEDDCLFDEPSLMTNKKRRKMKRLSLQQAHQQAQSLQQQSSASTEGGGST